MDNRTLDDLAERDLLAAVAPPRRREVSSVPINTDVPSAREAAVGIASIRAARHKPDFRPTFKLNNTGGVAVVKRPSMLALANAQSLPSELRPILEAIATRAVKEPGDDVVDALDKFDLDKMIELVDVTCIEGFINPRLVPADHIMNSKTSVERSLAPFPGADEFSRLEDEGWVRCNSDGRPYPADVMYLEEIDLDDRAEFFAWCNESRTQEARAVAPFPEQSQKPVSAPSGVRRLSR